MLLHSWATGGSWLKSQAAKSSSSSSASGSAQATPQQQQQQGEGLLSPEAAAAAVGSGGLQAAGSDWAATAAKAAQLRSVIEWGVEAYGVEEGGQQDGDVSVVIWPGEHSNYPKSSTASITVLFEIIVVALLRCQAVWFQV
jgi:hypothetical protein